MFSRFSSFSFYILIYSLLLLPLAVCAQDNWTLTTEHHDIKVYTRPIVNSKIKAIKVVCNLPVIPSQLLAAILDIRTCNEWVYHSKQNVMIRQISPLDFIYYSEVEVPWPVENRDYVVHIQAEQDPKTKVITVNSPCIPGYVAEKSGVVRISHSVGKWTITPLSNKMVRAEYVLEVDPLGTIPAWLINLFATKGPMETFEKLKIHVQQKEYINTHYQQIIE